MLPDDVQIIDLQEANSRTPEGLPWHAISDATGKLYSYKLWIGDWKDPTERLYRLRVYEECNIRKLELTMRLFERTHDFSSLCNSTREHRGTGKSLERTVRRAASVDEGEGRYRLDFEVNGALYGMIRNVVGTILSVGCNRLNLDDIHRVFDARDRRKAPKSAPARGLFLEHVYYDAPSKAGTPIVLKAVDARLLTDGSLHVVTLE